MYLEFLDKIEDLVNSLITHQVILASGFLLFVEEAGIPLPGADFAIAFTGYQVSLGRIHYFAAFMILALSDLLGATLLYYLSYKYGETLLLKTDKYIHLDKRKLASVENQFRKYGALVIIFGRHIPGFKVPITIFSGISSMNYKTFIISTFLSIVFWIPFFMSLGQRLGPRTVKFFHANHYYYFLIILPIIIAAAPILFLRKKSK